MSDRSTAFLSLGSNIGERLTHLRMAIRRLDCTVGIEVSAASPVYETAAHTRGAVSEMSDFLNVAVKIETSLSAEQLLNQCLSVESAGGRQRVQGSWIPRTIDIDILLYADQAIESECLKIPHPHMAERRFVLLPLDDLDPDAWVPAPFSATVSELLSGCKDSQRVDKRYPADAVLTKGG